MCQLSNLDSHKSCSYSFSREGDEPLMNLEPSLRKRNGCCNLGELDAAVIGGCQWNCNVRAGKLFGVPVLGTHAHILLYGFMKLTTQAFRAYAETRKGVSPSSIPMIPTYWGPCCYSGSAWKWEIKSIS